MFIYRYMAKKKQVCVFAWSSHHENRFPATLLEISVVSHQKFPAYFRPEISVIFEQKKKTENISIRYRDRTFVQKKTELSVIA